MAPAREGKPVYLRDIWPTAEEIQSTVEACVLPEMFEKQYAGAFTSNEKWNAIEITPGDLYDWNESSTYIQRPPFLEGITADVTPPTAIRAARCLAALGDSVTTDHISPAGAIAQKSPAGRVFDLRTISSHRDFNSYGSRRGNDRVMVRGTFANIRIRNQMVPETEGGYTQHIPSGERTAHL